MIEIRRHARWVALLGATAPLGLIGCTAADRAVLGATRAAAGVGITDARRVHIVGGAAFVVRRDASVLGWGNGRLASGGRRSPRGAGHPHADPVSGLADVIGIAENELTAIARSAATGPWPAGASTSPTCLAISTAAGWPPSPACPVR